MGDAIVTATVDTTVSPKGAPKGTPTTLLTLGEGSSIHICESPEDLFEALVELGSDEDSVEFELGDPEDDPEEAQVVVFSSRS
jgi:fructoselysine-6-P-deglycase FrlB-like protein